jgi:hypothetical protein
MTDSRWVLNLILPRFKVALSLLFCGLAGVGCAVAEAPVAAPVPALELAVGSLVYWSLDRSALVRADPGADALAPVELPFDPAGAGVPDEASDRACRKCHAFGGGRMAFTYFGIGGPGGVAAWPSGDVVVDNRADLPWSFPALDRTGERVVAGIGLRLSLFDASSGVALVDDIAGRPAAQPAFAANADTLIFVGDPQRQGAPADDPGEFDASDLYVGTLDAGSDVLVDVRMLVAGDGQALAYPTLSADGRFAVYTRAPWSQSARGDEITAGALEMVDVATGTQRTLLRAAPRGRAWMPSLLDDGEDLALAFVDRSSDVPQIRLARLRPSQAGDPSSSAIALPDPLSEPGFFPRFEP